MTDDVLTPDEQADLLTQYVQRLYESAPDQRTGEAWPTEATAPLEER